MQLPKLTAGTDPKQLSQLNVSSAVSIANAELGVIEAAGKLGNTLFHKAANNSKNQADIELSKGMTAWHNHHDAKEEYFAEELADIGIDEKYIRGRHVIPAYEVKDQLFEKEYSDAIKKNAETITPGLYRDNFLSEQESNKLSMHSELLIQSSKDQVKHENKQTIASIDQSMSDRMYPEAIMAVSNLSGLDYSDEIKQTLVTKIKNEQLMSKYEDIWTTDDYYAAKDALAVLYKEKDPNFADEKDHMHAITLMRQVISRYESFDAANKSAISGEVDRYNEANVTEQDSSPRYYRDLREKAIAAGVDNDKIIKMDNITAGSDIAKDTELLKPSEMTRTLSDIDYNTEQLSGANKVNAIISGKHAKKLIEQNKNDLQSDPYGYMIKKGHIKVPLDFSNVESLIPSIEYRKKTKAFVNAQSEQDAPWVSKDEANKAIQHLNNSSHEEVLRAAEAVSSVFGRDAGDFWTDIELDGYNPGVMSVVGRLVAKDRQDSAMVVLGGKEIRTSDPSMIQDKIITYRTEINSALGGAFAAESRNKYNTAVKESILNAYVYLANESGNLSGTMDSDILDNAINIVTNGMFDFNGTQVELPQGITETTFRTRFDLASALHFETHMGGVFEDTGSNFKEMVDEGNYVMESVGENEYVFFDTTRPKTPLSKGTLIMSNEFDSKGRRKPFIYSYSDNIDIDTNMQRELSNESPLVRLFRTGSLIRSNKEKSMLQTDAEFKKKIKKDFGQRLRNNMESNNRKQKEQNQ